MACGFILNEQRMFSESQEKAQPTSLTRKGLWLTRVPDSSLHTWALNKEYWVVATAWGGWKTGTRNVSSAGGFSGSETVPDDCECTASWEEGLEIKTTGHVMQQHQRQKLVEESRTKQYSRLDQSGYCTVCCLCAVQPLGAHSWFLVERRSREHPAKGAWDS